MTALLLCFTLAASPLSAPLRPYMMSDQWKLIDSGKRWKQVVWYSDGSRKCFIIEIPKMK